MDRKGSRPPGSCRTASSSGRPAESRRIVLGWGELVRKEVEYAPPVSGHHGARSDVQRVGSQSQRGSLASTITGEKPGNVLLLK